MDPNPLRDAIEKARSDEPAPRPEPERVPYLGFFVGSEIYGLPLQRLREVARVAHLRRVPGAPSGVAGLANLRGEIICAFDARAILGITNKAPNDAPFLVALRGFADPLGLVVDSIADIYSIAADDIEPPPVSWPADRAACLLGVARVPPGLLGLLDLDRVVKL